ncbi:hypothetical protein MRB53_006082 [Persea americana]|uniref:Uncharacterized protein n=1 Tax=Persea americana TaxID=3435 RepID=A0ACC2MF52_PERAE|nr:hypothetical protein MRB53_006082 [Persea americana]
MAPAIMKKMGYDAQNPIGLGGGRGILIPLEPTLAKSQLEDWKLYSRIDKSSYRLGYCRDPGPRFPSPGPRDGDVHPTMINPQVGQPPIDRPRADHALCRNWVTVILTNTGAASRGSTVG